MGGLPTFLLVSKLAGGFCIAELSLAAKYREGKSTGSKLLSNMIHGAYESVIKFNKLGMELVDMVNASKFYEIYSATYSTLQRTSYSSISSLTETKNANRSVYIFNTSD